MDECPCFCCSAETAPINQANSSHVVDIRGSASSFQLRPNGGMSSCEWRKLEKCGRRDSKNSPQKQTRRIWMLRYVTATRFRRKGRPRMWYWVGGGHPSDRVKQAVRPSSCKHLELSSQIAARFVVCPEHLIHKPQRFG